jgi:tryptophan synthase alpha chain
MAHVYYGDPSEDFSQKQIKALCENGVDIVEFGIPFSDPTADGPVFQRACERALRGGMTPKKAIDGIKILKDKGISQSIVVTSYYNIIFRMGVDNFVQSIHEAGACGLIVPNVPMEEAQSLLEAAAKYEIDIIFLVAPTTSDLRLKKILKISKGFVYVVAVTGVTGARRELEKTTLELVNRIRKFSDIPLLVGFGISQPEHAEAIIRSGANGVITGSAIGRIYEKHLDDVDYSLEEIGSFAQGIKEGCIRGWKTLNIG